MTESMWRPLGVESEAEVAEYDALHPGVPAWMHSSLWEWIKTELRAVRNTGSYNNSTTIRVRATLLEEMCETLQIPMPSFRHRGAGESVVRDAATQLQERADAIQVADYLLAHNSGARADSLDALLARSRSVWQVGIRSGRPGLTRRVPLGVQVASDDVMERSGQAGVRLAKAWESLYGVDPNPSEAYRLAIQAVEDAAIPVVSPANQRATLGTVLRDLESQANWRLPLQREHDNAKGGDVVVAMARMLWHGQHDRHGGQPAAPGDLSVSAEEATVAVSIAVTLVQLFTGGLVARAPGQAITDAGDAPGT